MPAEIPLRPIAAQSMAIILDKQNCKVRFYWRDNLYADLDVADENIFRGVICRDRTGLKLYRYQKFAGQLMFTDIEGKTEPQIAGLGSRYKLMYYTAAEAESMLTEGFYV